MIGLHLRGRGSQTVLIPGPQNLHFKHGGCGLCILEWLVKYCFFTASTSTCMSVLKDSSALKELIDFSHH